MQLSPIGLAASELDTPALLIDLEHLQHNIDRMAGMFPRACGWRGGLTPRRSSARRSPTCCARSGAIGVTVAKVSRSRGHGRRRHRRHFDRSPGRGSKQGRAAGGPSASGRRQGHRRPRRAPRSLGQRGRRCGRDDRRTRRRRHRHETNGRCHNRGRSETCPASFSHVGPAFRRTDGLRGSYLDDPGPGGEARGRRARRSQRCSRLATMSRQPASAAGSSRPAGSGSYQYTADISQASPRSRPAAVSSPASTTHGSAASPATAPHSPCWRPSSAGRHPIVPSSTSVRSP